MFYISGCLLSDYVVEPANSNLANLLDSLWLKWDILKIIKKYEHDIDEWTHGILWNVVDVVTDATTKQRHRNSLFVLSQLRNEKPFWDFYSAKLVPYKSLKLFDASGPSWSSFINLKKLKTIPCCLLVSLTLRKSYDTGIRTGHPDLAIGSMFFALTRGK